MPVIRILLFPLRLMFAVGCVVVIVAAYPVLALFGRSKGHR